MTDGARPPTAKHERSPSAWRRRWPAVLFAAVNLAIAVHLAMYQLRAAGDVWDPVFGDGSRQVLESQVSETLRAWLFGMPDAAVGAAAYAVELVLAVVGGTDRWRKHPRLVLLFGANTLALGLAGVGLVAMQAFVVRAWCLLCLVAAALSVALVFTVYDEARASWTSLRTS